MWHVVMAHKIVFYGLGYRRAAKPFSLPGNWKEFSRSVLRHGYRSSTPAEHFSMPGNRKEISRSVLHAWKLERVFPFGFPSGAQILYASGPYGSSSVLFGEKTHRTEERRQAMPQLSIAGTVKGSPYGSRLMSMALVTRLVSGIRKTASSAALMPLHQVCSCPCTASRGLKSLSPTLQQPRLGTNRAGMQSLGLGANVAFKSITEVPPHLNRLRNSGPKTRFHTLSNRRVLGLTRAVLASGGDGDARQEEDTLHKRGMASSKKKGQPRGTLWRTRSVISRETVQAVHDLKRNKDDPVELAKVFQTRIPRLLKMDLLATLSELQRQNEIDLALRIFDIVRKEIWYKPDQYLYREMLDALGRNRRISEIEKKFQELQDEGIKPEVVIYRELVGAYVRAHMLPEALEVHAKMVELGCGDDALSLKFIAIGKEKEAVRIKQRKKAAEKLDAEKREQESSLSEVQS